MNDKAVKLLKDLLSIHSVNHRDDEGAVAEYIKEYLSDAGISSQVQRIDDTHANIIACVEGKESGRRVVWNGHMDTVPYGDMDTWHTDPAVPTLKDGKIYARGASDMKSGLAAMVYTLAHIVREGNRPAHTITLIGTCDEERDGLGAQKILEAGLLPEVDEILIGEPTGLALGIAQKGCLWLEFIVHGKASHGAYPERGISAVEIAIDIAQKVGEYVRKATHPVLGHATAQVTQIDGGTAPNMTPDTCRVLMDIRLVPGQSVEQVLAYASELKSHLQTGASLEVSVRNSRMAIETDPQGRFAQRIRTVIKSAEIDLPDIGINYFTDASILIKSKPDTQVVLFGPGEPDLCHQPDEYVELEKYMKAIEILSVYAMI